jgi:hypothetical protein
MARIVRSSEPPAASAVERVLAIDPALRKTGWAVVECEKGQLKALAWGVIHNKPNLLPSGCLVAIREGLIEAIREHAPTVCAIESTIFVQSFKTCWAEWLTKSTVTPEFLISSRSRRGLSRVADTSALCTSSWLELCRVREVKFSFPNCSPVLGTSYFEANY